MSSRLRKTFTVYCGTVVAMAGVVIVYVALTLE